MSAPTATPPLKTEAQPDANWLSLERNGQTWFAGTDRAVPAPSPEDGMELIPEHPKAWESALKLSGRQWTTLKDLRIAQCKETAIDINAESAFISLSGEIGLVGEEGQQVIVVKGGSHDVRIAGPVHSRGTRADVVVGGWSDQSHEPCYELDFRHLYRATGGTLTFVFGRVKDPFSAARGRAKHIRLPDGAKVLFWRSLAEQGYWWLKLAGVKLGLIKGRRA